VTGASLGVATRAPVARRTHVTAAVSAAASQERATAPSKARSFFGNSTARFAVSARRTATRARPSLKVFANEDYYQTLGVNRGATAKEIKTAYRQKARKFHPDVNKEAGAEATFKKISNAYEVLSDDQKRPIYDKYGEAGLKGMGGMGGGGAGPGDFTNPFDLFETFFGGGMGGGGGQRARSRPQQGDDERYDLSLSFLEAVFGTEKELETMRLEGCDTCSGSGVKAGTEPNTCSACGGAGQVITTARTPLGNFQQVTTCPQCSGTGQISQSCGSCGGDGRVRRSKRISLRVPAGVDSGSRLRVRGEGNAGRRGGPEGDLYVFISVRPDPVLQRDGININCGVSISYIDAILGTTVQVNTIDGPVDLKVPAGVQPGTTLLMAKKGVPRLGNATLRGDQLVTVSVSIPQRLSSAEKKLVEQLSGLQSGKPGEKAGKKGGSWL